MVNSLWLMIVSLSISSEKKDKQRKVFILQSPGLMEASDTEDPNQHTGLYYYISHVAQNLAKILTLTQKK